MGDASNLVIKLKYGDICRRFIVSFADIELDLDIETLTEKICSLFNLAPSSELRLSYIDEDGDEVALVDDDDICDILNQNINPLRITVKLEIPDKVGQIDHPQEQKMDSGVVLKLLAGLALSHSLYLSAVIDSFTKTGKSCLACAATETTSESDVSEKTKSLKPSEDDDSASSETQSSDESVEQPLKPMEALESEPEVISPLFNAASLDSKPTNDDKAAIVSSQKPVLISAGEIEKTKKEESGGLGECDSNGSSFTTSSDGADRVCTAMGDDKLGIQDFALNGPVIKYFESIGLHNMQGSNKSSRVDPISRPCFESKIKMNYDPGMIRNAGAGNARDYLGMDCPVVYPHDLLRDYSRREERESASRLDCKDFWARPLWHKLDNCFVEDVNIEDGTVFAPSTPFTKIWRMRNTGTVMWPRATELVWIGGHRFDHPFSAGVKILAAGVDIGQELDVAVDCISPEAPGYYASFWQMATPSGHKFGRPISLFIQVAAKPMSKDCHTNPGTLHSRKPMESVEDSPVSAPSRLLPSPVSCPVTDFPHVASPISSSNELPLFRKESVANQVDSADMAPVLNDKFVHLSRDDMKPDDPNRVYLRDSILDSLYMTMQDFHDREENKKRLEMNDPSIKGIAASSPSWYQTRF